MNSNLTKLQSSELYSCPLSSCAAIVITGNLISDSVPDWRITGRSVPAPNPYHGYLRKHRFFFTPNSNFDDRLPSQSPGYGPSPITSRLNPDPPLPNVLSERWRGRPGANGWISTSRTYPRQQQI